MNENNERLTPNQESNNVKKTSDQKPNGRHALKKCPECSTFVSVFLFFEDELYKKTNEYFRDQ